MADAKYEMTDRGFKHYEPIETTYGHEVRVYESSAASAPHIWVSIDGDCHLAEDDLPRPVAGVAGGVAKGSAAAHMTLGQARELRDELDAAIRGHYQVGDD